LVTITVYGKETCQLCGHVKRKLAVSLKKWGYEQNVQIFYWDMDTEEGLTEATFNDVNKTPTTVVARDGQHVARWDGQVPDSQELKLCIDGTNVVAQN
jgi:hypothetical protein